MKRFTAIALAALMVLTVFASVIPASAVTVSTVEIRGTVQEGDGNYTWGAQDFSAFWYDIDKNQSTELLTINVTGDEIIGKDDLTYSTGPTWIAYKNPEMNNAYNASQPNDIKINEFFSDRGPHLAGYPVQGWLSEKYVAIGAANKISKLVYAMSSSDKKTLRTGESWDLGEGYTLMIEQIDKDGNKVWMTLQKDGSEVESGIVQPGTSADIGTHTFVYVKDNMEGEDDVPIFSVYVDSVFAGATTDLAQLKYALLISDNVEKISTGDTYGELEVTEAGDLTITMVNKDSILTLSKDTTIDIAAGIKLKSADNVENPARFYPFVEKTAPGTYELRGTVQEGDGDYAWGAQNFSAFWYDIDKDQSTESLTINVTGNETIDKDKLIYSTGPAWIAYKNPEMNNAYNASQPNDIKINEFFSDRGPHLAGYPVQGWLSEKYVAIGAANKISKLVYEMSSSDKKTLRTGESWDLGEGYTLLIEQIDKDGNKVWMTLQKDGSEVESGIVQPGTSADIGNHTFVYVKDNMEGEDDVPIFSVYVDSVFAGATTDLAQLKYALLISDNVEKISTGDTFGELEVTEAGDLTVKMVNKDSVLTLSKDTTIDIAAGIKLKSADNVELAARFYPFVERTITGEAPVEEPAVEEPAVEEPAVEEPAVEEPAVGEPAVEEPAVVEPAVEEPEVEAEPPEEEPGFEAIFAIAGLLAVAYLVRRN